MNLLYADTKYADMLEWTMYNAGISGVSLEGDRFFYSNPLHISMKIMNRSYSLKDLKLNTTKICWVELSHLMDMHHCPESKMRLI
jgi:DUF1680 family protein